MITMTIVLPLMLMLMLMLLTLSAVDALGLLGSALFVLCVALLSGAAVARRAARVDPMVTLRYE
jgi:ABC-type antimicrobial peptide transport system permease subunit